MIKVIRKKTLILVSIILLIVVATIVIVATVPQYYTNNGIGIERSWNISLPNGMVRVTHQEKTNFTGEGSRYNLYRLKKPSPEFESSLNPKSNANEKKIFESEFNSVYIDTGLSIDTEHLPNWSQDYRYKSITDFDRILYMVYFLENRYLVILEIMK